MLWECPAYKDSRDIFMIKPDLVTGTGGCAHRREEARTSGAMPIDHEECNCIILFDTA